MISTLEEKLKSKDEELDETIREHEKFRNEVNENSEDVNLLMLRKLHSDLKKEVIKLNETHKKETESLRKDKKRLDDELRTAVIENRNSDDGKRQ